MRLLLLAAFFCALPLLADSVAGLNRYRALAGLPPVSEDPLFVKACISHAEYLIKNAPEGDEAFIPHEQIKGKPGYSEAGAKCAENSVIISQIGLAEAYDFWMATPFHRVPLLDPGLLRAGGGSASGGPLGTATVVDVFTARRSTQMMVVPFPAEGQTGVPRTFGLFRKNFQVKEYPDPLADDEDGKAGYPVTLTFFGARSIKSAQGELRLGSEIVPVWFSSPEKPSIDEPTQQNTIVLIPRDPLKPNVRYTANVKAVVDGVAVQRAWSFTTGSFPQE